MHLWYKNKEYNHLKNHLIKFYILNFLRLPSMYDWISLIMMMKILKKWIKWYQKVVLEKFK